MIIASINCSGESLEKVIVLFYLSYKHNRDFYDRFTKVLLFYSCNLPKKNKSLMSMSGTISALNEQVLQANTREYGLMANRGLIIDSMMRHNLISCRAGESLKNDSKRLDKVVPNVPARKLFPCYYETLLKAFKVAFPFVELVHIDLREELEWFVDNMCYIDGYSKLFGLQCDGGIASFDIGNWTAVKRLSMVKRIKRSICISPNVYAFLYAINLKLQRLEDEVVVGYRPMTRYKRSSYDCAIKDLQKNFKTIIEPRNIAFSDVLDGISNLLSVEERSNIGVLLSMAKFIAKVVDAPLSQCPAGYKAEAKFKRCDNNRGLLMEQNCGV